MLAVASGTVIVAGDDQVEVYGLKPNFYGQLVIVQLDREFHEQPVFVLYGHLSLVMAHVGQRVDKGEVLGEVGMTGVAIGPHLHFEVRVGANTYADTRNPELWLKPLPGHGTIAGRLLDAEGNPIPEVLINFHQAEQADRRWRKSRRGMGRELCDGGCAGRRLRAEDQRKRAFIHPRGKCRSRDNLFHHHRDAEIDLGKQVNTRQRLYFPSLAGRGQGRVGCARRS